MDQVSQIRSERWAARHTSASPWTRIGAYSRPNRRAAPSDRCRGRSQVVGLRLSAANLRAVRVQIEVLQELVVGLLARLALAAGLLGRVLQLLHVLQELLGFLLGPAQAIEQFRLLLGLLVLEMLQGQIDLLLGELEIGRVGFALGRWRCGGRRCLSRPPGCRRQEVRSLAGPACWEDWVPGWPPLDVSWLSAEFCAGSPCGFCELSLAV